MKHLPSRDINGKCEGECRDIVLDACTKHQRELNKVDYSGGSSPSVSWAKSRTEQPGFLGGHV